MITSDTESLAIRTEPQSQEERVLLAVVVPMFNEEKNAERCVRGICAVLLDRLPGAKLFVVNDGSQDNTLAVLRSLESVELPFVTVDCKINGGYGGACIEGMRAAYAAGFAFGLVMDSDLTNDPGLIPQFAELLSTGKYDLIKASRYVEGGGMQGVPRYRQAYTILGNIVARWLFNMGISDCTNGFHAVRLSMVVEGSFKERGFPFLLEELLALKRQGAVAAEIPYVLTARRADEGESKFSYRPSVLWGYLKYALRAAMVRSTGKNRCLLSDPKPNELSSMR